MCKDYENNSEINFHFPRFNYYSNLFLWLTDDAHEN